MKRPPPCTVMPGLAVRVLCATSLSMSAELRPRRAVWGEAVEDPAADGVAAGAGRRSAVLAHAGVPQRQHTDVRDPAALEGRGSRGRRRGHAVVTNALSLIVIRSNAAVTIAPAPACASPAGDVAVTLLPVKRVLPIGE